VFWALGLLGGFISNNPDFLAFFWVWTFVPFAIHLLALMLYTIRWNPNTLARKRKIDAASVSYAGDYRLDADKQYTVGDDGELVEVLTEAQTVNLAKNRPYIK
jgi:hypothetical protein